MTTAVHGAPPELLRMAAHPLRWSLLTALADGDLRVRELVARVGEPQNLVSYHLRLLREGGLVTMTQSTYDGRDAYYHLDPDRCEAALSDVGAALRPVPCTPPERSAGGRRTRRLSVLFVCTGNSARSPIAEALLRSHVGDRVVASSAGTHPHERMHPHAVRTLGEDFGIDATGWRPRHVSTLVGRRFDRVITLCDKAREGSPEFHPAPHLTHWSIPDPAAAGPGRAGYAAYRAAAAEINTRIRHLLPALDTSHP